MVHDYMICLCSKFLSPIWPRAVQSTDSTHTKQNKTCMQLLLLYIYIYLFDVFTIYSTYSCHSLIMFDRFLYIFFQFKGKAPGTSWHRLLMPPHRFPRVKPRCHRPQKRNWMQLGLDPKDVQMLNIYYKICNRMCICIYMFRYQIYIVY